MLEPLPPNFICRPYRNLSVQEIPVPLEEAAIRAYLIRRPVYRRTEVMVVRREDELAVVRLLKADTGALFEPVTDVLMVAGPGDVAYVVDAGVDTANASQLAHAALGSGEEALAYVVEGAYQHVNVLVRPSPVVVRVVEVVPPEPPKLLEMARRVVDYDEELPPVELELAEIDLRLLASRNPASHFLFPCRCAGLELDASVDFLDAGPERPGDWTLIGCERSRQIHEALYGVDPSDRVDFCPEVVDGETDRPTLAKCCLRERGIERRGSRVIVPWGASLEEVRAALQLLTGVRETLPAAAAP